MSKDIVDRPRASSGFEVSLQDFRSQARAAGFWRGLCVGFASAFFLFDQALAHGAAVQAAISFAAAHPATVTAVFVATVGPLVLAPPLAWAVREQRERRGKLRRVRERLGL